MSACVQDVDIALEAAEFDESASEDGVLVVDEGRRETGANSHGSTKSTHLVGASAPATGTLPYRKDRPEALRIGVEKGLDAVADQFCAAYRDSGDAIAIEIRRDESTRLRSALELRKLDAVFSRKALAHRERRRGLFSHELEHFALVPIVHEGNPVKRLDSLRLGALLAGQETTWVDLTRSHASVEVFGMRRPSVRQEIDIPALFPGRVLRVSTTYASDLEIMRAVARRPASIALVDFDFAMRQENAALRKGLRFLSLSGIQPVAKNIRERRWPLAWSLRLVGSKHSATRASKHFFDVIRRAARSGLQVAAPR